MKFEIDKQTLKDLEIFRSEPDGKSVSELFNHAISLGGKKKLYSFLNNPLTDLDRINERKSAVIFFQKHLSNGLSLNKDYLDFSEFYLKNANSPIRQPSVFFALEQRALDMISTGADYYLLKKGVMSTIGLVKDMYSLTQSLDEIFKTGDCPDILKRNNDRILSILKHPDFKEMLSDEKLNSYQVAKYDYTFRSSRKSDIEFIHNLIYEYDAYYSIAKAMSLYGFIYPEFVDTNENCFQVKGLYHPLLDNAIVNDIELGDKNNLIFVSGPNMAGKSTFLKALGIAGYLAHIGFPVPAKEMKLSLLSGIFTTINITDNLSSGYSHFYAEVMRIKDVALKLKTNNNMLVIFDELFRGTNVKDAYDGTLAVTKAFARIETSFFVISSHIVEVADALKNEKNIKFGYLDIEQKDGHPIYTFKLKEGVSEVRLGMYIINKEGLIELIENAKN